MSGNTSQKLLGQLPCLAACWQAGELEASLFAARYFLHWQIATHGPRFASRKRKRDPRPEADECLAVLAAWPRAAPRASLVDWLERYQFRGVSDHVTVALVQWLRGAWPLILHLDVPLPLEVLRLQARGTRAVTAIAAYPRMREPVLDKSDAFAFFRHDLEHGYKFFHSPARHDAQRAYFVALETAFDRGVFTPYLDNPEFAGKFHYLMSDMNTHPEHGRQYLRAILIEYYLRRERKALTAPLSAASELAIVGVLNAVAAAPPSGDVGPETPGLLRWDSTPAAQRLSA